MEKRHKFEYIVERDLIDKQRLDSRGREDFINEEMKNIGKVGFSKQKDYESLVKNKIKHTKIILGNIPQENPFDHNINNIKNDVNYVKKLAEFEKRFLPDVKLLK